MAAVTLASILGLIIRLALLAWAVYLAYDIRMYAIRIYGRIIHEFDPWFNFHATRYLFDNGLKKFFTWFDHTVWYPLGRPVGTTIFPGMQLTSVSIWWVLDRIGLKMSLNDVCVFVPTWFGGLASVLTGFLAAECSGIKTSAPAAALVMAIIPAHIMRSVGGGFDNESIAVAAMVATFYCWTRSLRNEKSWSFAVVAGLAYTYMVAAWGGYVFVINVVGAHAALLVLLGRFNDSVYKAYTLFFIVGTFGAIQVPCVAWVPLKSLEQIGPLGVFGLYQLLQLCEVLRQRQGLERNSRKFFQLRRNVFLAAGGLGALVLAALIQQGRLTPLSPRVRGLFLNAVKTGNPLVDSVAEHQPSTHRAYWQYLQYTCFVAPFGWLLQFYKPTNNKIFLLMYSALGLFFCNKMSRLIILMGPIASALSGVAIGAVVEWSLVQLLIALEPFRRRRGAAAAPTAAAAAEPAASTENEVPASVDDDAAAAAAGTPAKKSEKQQEKKTPAKGGKEEAKQSPVKVKGEAKGDKQPASTSALRRLGRAISTKAAQAYGSVLGKILRMAAALAFLVAIPYFSQPFYAYCNMFAHHISHPTLIFKGQLQNGQEVMVTDYLDSYNWLKQNTPQDARVLSWWDYGYQITGIANRTTLADGNTWNIHHIALIGRCLTSEEKRAHKLIRHLADYVLVWSGGGGDDLAKSPHIARIGTSVYHDICPNDPMCYNFGFTDNRGTPTPTMAASLLYKLCMNGFAPGVSVDEKLFKEVHMSKYGKVRIYKVMKVSKKSKKWAADPANWLCDRPGSWYCPGQYPPDLPEKIGTSYKTLDYAAHGA